MFFNRLAKWKEKLDGKFKQKQQENAEKRKKARQARRRWKDREVAILSSPGRVAEGRARPTTKALGKGLNTVTFRDYPPQLLFSDGSFRNPGRRRLRVIKDGRLVLLSGRQLRKLRKRTRLVLKARAASGRGDSISTNTI